LVKRRNKMSDYVVEICDEAFGEGNYILTSIDDEDE